MSESSDPSRASSGTLYDPDSEPLEEPESEDDQVALRLSLPPQRAERLRAVAHQLGLTPSLVAKRAIQLVCDEVVTTEADLPRSPLLIDQYQARLDLLHAVDDPQNGTLEPPSDE